MDAVLGLGVGCGQPHKMTFNHTKKSGMFLQTAQYATDFQTINCCDKFRAGRRLKFLIAINLMIKKIISVNVMFNHKILFQIPCDMNQNCQK